VLNPPIFKHDQPPQGIIMNSDPIQALLSELDLAMPEIQKLEYPKFHWTVINRIPESFGKVKLISQIGIRGVNHHNEIYNSNVISNTADNAQWTGATTCKTYAQIAICRIIFNDNTCLTDILNADVGECPLNATWVVEPKTTIALNLLETGELSLADIFILRRI
jgi:hypothetical protein